MKKSAILSILFCAGIFAGTFVFAEEQEDMQPQERRGEGMMMDGEGMGGSQRTGMKGDHKGMGMKGGMHGPSSMVALADGSIVVLSGNKLTKYDADLNVVKEVEVKGGPKPPMDKQPAPPAGEDAAEAAPRPEEDVQWGQNKLLTLSSRGCYIYAHPM